MLMTQLNCHNSRLIIVEKDVKLLQLGYVYVEKEEPVIIKDFLSSK